MGLWSCIYVYVFGVENEEYRHIYFYLSTITVLFISYFRQVFFKHSSLLIRIVLMCFEVSISFFIR